MRTGFLLLTAAAASGCLSMTGGGETLSPRVHAFYYPWYGNPATEGHWLHWDHAIAVEGAGHHHPPEQIGANFYPAIGLYSSKNPTDVAQHMEQLRQAGVGVIATSWWGEGDCTDQALPILMDAAADAGIQVCFHLEPFAGRDKPPAKAYRDAIAFVLEHYGNHPAFYRCAERDNKPLFYVYDSYLVDPADWASVLQPDGAQTIRGTGLDALVIGLYVSRDDDKAILEAGFDGFYTYFATDGFTYGSTVRHWPDLAAFADEHDLLFIPSVGPGYDDTRIRPWNTANQRDRENGAYYDRLWKAALEVEPPFVSITSFDEWHEGTQIAPVVPKATPTYTYIDYRPHEPDYYLERTRHWVQRYSRLCRGTP